MAHVTEVGWEALRLTVDPVVGWADPDLWGTYFRGQLTAYGRYGLARMVLEAEAAPRDDALPVLAWSDGMGCVAGTRLHLRTPETELPIERLFREDPRLEPRIRLSAKDRICEIAGLWADHRTVRHDVGNRVAAVAIGWATALGFERVIILAPETRGCYAVLGFEIDPAFPAYAYPNPHYRSRVCRLALSETLDSVPGPYRELALRARDAWRARAPLLFDSAPESVIGTGPR